MSGAPRPGQSGKSGRHVNTALVVMSLVLALGLLGYVSSVAAARQSGPELATIARRTWLPIFLLTLPYLGARFLVWHALLEELHITVPWRDALASFAAGEIGKYAPAGAYVENYLLAGLSHVEQRDAVRSTVATMAPLVLETLLALPIAVIVGIPHNRWVSWTLLAIVLAWVPLLAATWKAVRSQSVHLTPKTPSWLRQVLVGVVDILEAVPDLLTPRTAWLLLPTAIYMLTRVAALYLIVLALGVHYISFRDMMAVYAMIVLVNILVPIKTEVGVMELTGMAELRAFGMPASQAALVMLAYRLLARGMTILMAARSSRRCGLSHWCAPGRQQDDEVDPLRVGIIQEGPGNRPRDAPRAR